MPDDNVTPEEVQDGDVILLNGEEITEDEFHTKVKGLIKTERMSISIGEKRAKRQYEMNEYHETTELEIGGLSPFLDSLQVSQKMRRKLSAMAVGQLTTRVNQMYNFMKASIHAQQEVDEMPIIDYRPGEKQENGDA
ncbi:MAG: hypothetical protein DRP42_05325 [Tenericutes bacterium]|nr:MAG: hypothetical protein DRP42_05325 [Mycoplasmatota bacterium]